MPCLGATVIHSDQDILKVILARLDATHVRDIQLDAYDRRDRLIYRARHGDRTAFVDRPLAIRLRESGAVWCGDVLEDPCAVA